MEHTRPDMSPEELLESITLEALSALALSTPGNIRDIEPLEAVLPLIAKGWGLPEEVLANRAGRLEQGKKLAAENKGGVPKEDPAVREQICGKTRGLVDHLYAHGLAKTA